MKPNYNDHGGSSGGALGYNSATGGPTSEGLVSNALNEQMAVVKDLHCVLFTLRERLNCVLSVATPTSADRGGIDAQAIEPMRIYSRVNIATSGIQDAAAMVRDILNRLEL